MATRQTRSILIHDVELPLVSGLIPQARSIDDLTLGGIYGIGLKASAKRAVHVTEGLFLALAILGFGLAALGVPYAGLVGFLSVVALGYASFHSFVAEPYVPFTLVIAVLHQHATEETRDTPFQYDLDVIPSRAGEAFCTTWDGPYGPLLKGTVLPVIREAWFATRDTPGGGNQSVAEQARKHMRPVLARHPDVAHALETVAAVYLAAYEHPDAFQPGQPTLEFPAGEEVLPAPVHVPPPPRLSTNTSPITGPEDTP